MVLLNFQFKEGNVEISSCSCIDCKASCDRIQFDLIEEYNEDGYSVEIKVESLIWDLIWSIVAIGAVFVGIVIFSYILRKPLLNLLLSGMAQKMIIFP